MFSKVENPVKGRKQLQVYKSLNTPKAIYRVNVALFNQERLIFK